MNCPYGIKDECDKTHLMKRLVYVPLTTPDPTVCNNCILVTLFLERHRE